MILIGVFSFAYVDTLAYAETSFVPFTLKVGKTASVDSVLNVTFLNVTEDSRCLSDVTCVWQGAASINLSVKTNQKDFGTSIVALGDDADKPSQNFDGYFVRLTQLEPYPISTHQIASSEYVATLFVGTVNGSVLSSLKQVKNGIEPAAVKCKEGLVLILKHGNDSPACVKVTTAEVLYDRNWGSAPPPCCKH